MKIALIFLVHPLDLWVFFFFWKQCVFGFCSHRWLNRWNQSTSFCRWHFVDRFGWKLLNLVTRGLPTNQQLLLSTRTASKSCCIWTLKSHWLHVNMCGVPSITLWFETKRFHLIGLGGADYWILATATAVWSVAPKLSKKFVIFFQTRVSISDKIKKQTNIATQKTWKHLKFCKKRFLHSHDVVFQKYGKRKIMEISFSFAGHNIQGYEISSLQMKIQRCAWMKEIIKCFSSSTQREKNNTTTRLDRKHSKHRVAFGGLISKVKSLDTRFHTYRRISIIEYFYTHV